MGYKRPLRPIHMGSEVPSPTHVSRSQHGGKVPSFEPQEPLKYGLFSSKLDLDYFMQKYSRDLC